MAISDISEATESTPDIPIGLNSAGLNSAPDPNVVDLDGLGRPATDLSSPLTLDTKGIWTRNFPTTDWEVSPIDSTSTGVPSVLFDQEPSFYDTSPISSDYYSASGNGVEPFDAAWNSPRQLRPSSLQLTSGNGYHSKIEDSHPQSPPPSSVEAPRRRNRRRNTADSSSNGSSETQISNRERFLERNRIAAAKCRQRKKEWTGNLEAKARDLSKQNTLLQHIVDVQRGEIMALKGAVLEHAQCGSMDIEKFFCYDAGQRSIEQQNMHGGVKAENEMEI